MGDYKDELLLHAMLTGVIPLTDARANWDNFAPDLVLQKICRGNKEFDASAIRWLSENRSRFETQDKAIFLAKIKTYSEETGDAQFTLARQALRDELLQEAHQAKKLKDESSLLWVCCNLIECVPDLWDTALKLLEENTKAFSCTVEVQIVLDSYIEDRGISPPLWVLERVRDFLSWNAEDIGTIYASYEEIRPTVLEAFALFLENLGLSSLSELTIPHWPPFVDMWYNEMAKPQRAAQMKAFFNVT